MIMIFTIMRHISIAIFSLLSICSFAQELSYTQYTIKDGLPQMQIDGICTDHKGNLWIATRGGISRFDGEQFENFDDIDCLPSHPKAISEGKAGNIWIYGRSSLIKFNGVDCEEFNFPEWAQFKFSKIMTCLDDGSIIGSSYGNGHWVFQQDTFVRLHDYLGLNSELKITGITKDTSRNLWIIANNEKILVWKEGHILKEINTDASGIFLSGRAIGHLINKENLIRLRNKEKDNHTYVTLDNNLNLKINCVHNSDFRCRLEPDGNNHSYFSNNKDWISINDYKSGNSYIINNQKRRFNVVHRLRELDDITYLYTDKGLVTFDKNKFISFSEDVLPNIWAVQEIDSTIYVGSYGNGLFSISKNGINTINTKTVPCIHNIHTDSDHSWGANLIYYHPAKDKGGNLYFPTSNGLTKLTQRNATMYFASCNAKPNKRRAVLYAEIDPKTEEIITCMCDEVIWIDKKANISKTLTKDELGMESCALSAIPHVDTVYITYKPHIAKYYGGQLELISYREEETYVCGIVDHKDNVWFGGSKGLYHIAGDSLERLPFLEGKRIHAMVQYSNDKVFMSTLEGLIMWNLEKYLIQGIVEYRLYNHSNGFTGLEPDQNGLFIDSRGRLWVTSATHLSYTFPEGLHYINNDVKLNIIKINDTHTLLTANGTHKLGINQNEADIEIAVVGIERPVEYTLRYKLCNGEEKIALDNKYIRLDNLSSGDHNLLLHLTDKNGQALAVLHNTLLVDIPIKMEPWWSKALLSSVFGLLLISLYRYHRYKLVKFDNQNLIFEKAELESINKRLTNDLERNKQSKQIYTDPKIELPGQKKTHIILSADILYIKAEKNGCKVFRIDNTTIWTDLPLKEMVKLLPYKFIRIYRSTIVNIDCVEWINPNTLKMKDGEELKIGRTYKKDILNKLS